MLVVLLAPIRDDDDAIVCDPRQHQNEKSQENTKRSGPVAFSTIEKIAAACAGLGADFDNCRASISKLLKESALFDLAR